MSQSMEWRYVDAGLGDRIHTGIRGDWRATICETRDGTMLRNSIAVRRSGREPLVSRTVSRDVPVSLLRIMALEVIMVHERIEGLA